MPARDPFKLPYPHGARRLDTMSDLLKDNSKQPPTGLTQGGSSRKARGAKVAATDGQVRQTQTGD